MMEICQLRVEFKEESKYIHRKSFRQAKEVILDFVHLIVNVVSDYLFFLKNDIKITSILRKSSFQSQLYDSKFKSKSIFLQVRIIMSVMYRILFVLQQFNKVLFLMLKHSALPKLSSKNLKPLTIESLQSSLLDTLKTIKTPRHESYMFKDLEAEKTQKFRVAKKATSSRTKLPSISRNQYIHKENLLDLDICFDFESSQLCQNDGSTERKNFVIKTSFKTPSITSKGIITTANSSDSSLKGTQQIFQMDKNETASKKESLECRRGRSYTKNMPACRIAHSKKLPFDLNPQKIQRQRPVQDEFLLDISVIENKINDDCLISYESYKNLLDFI